MDSVPVKEGLDVTEKYMTESRFIVVKDVDNSNDDGTFTVDFKINKEYYKGIFLKLKSSCNSHIKITTTHNQIILYVIFFESLSSLHLCPCQITINTEKYQILR